MCCLSLSLFLASFGSQYSVRDFGTRVILHLELEC